ncbi:MAG TPA: peptidase C1, partial [Methanotrichaceae archaeon]|nr:peptidase C1 [Methanotrichaceae archaeon]
MVFLPAASAADDNELMTMRDAVVATGADWAAIEDFLLTLPPEDRQLVIDTYPERIAELEEIQKSITEAGANWTAGLNTVSILPPELRPGTGAFPLPAEADGVPHEIVTIGPSEGVLPASELPESWDWRSAYGYDWTTPIKNQGSCGSCWAFGALGAVESRVKLAADNPGLTPDFSEQYLLSCSPGDCSGGYSDVTANWITCEGTVDEACFPYVAQDTVPCSDSCFDRESRDYKGEGWYWVCDYWWIVDVDRIKQEIISGGPVPNHMMVYSDLYDYTGGVYTHTSGTQLGGHCIDIVGWGDDGFDDYWICKNSWGTTWGEAGWFKIKMGEVEIGTQAIAYQPKIRGKALLYEGHVPAYGGEFRLSDGYMQWGNLLASNGYLVHGSTTTTLTASLLDCYDVVIIADPTVAFSSSELAAIKDFVGEGRVIASGDGDLFSSKNGDYIHLQDNERMAVEYIDWLATGEGNGLLIIGENHVSSSGPPNQVANMFGLKFNNDAIYDTKRYDTNTYWPILGPEDDVEVLAGCSLSISKDAVALARATSSGYVAAPPAAGGTGVRSDEPGGESASEEMLHVGEIPEMEDILTPEDLKLEVMSDISAAEAAGDGLEPGDMPPEEEPGLAPEDLGAVVAGDLPPAGAGLSFTGPIGIAAIDLGRKGEDTIGIFAPSSGNWYLNYDNDGVTDKSIHYGASTHLPVTGDWNG